MMEYRNAIVVFLVLLASYSQALANTVGGTRSDAGASDKIVTDNSRMTKEKAEQAAIETLGLAERGDSSTWRGQRDSELSTHSDTTLPFLGVQLSNREVYLVAMKGVPLRFTKATGRDSVTLEGTRDFEVMLDAGSGQLLKVTSTLPSFHEKLRSGSIRKPTAQDAENQLRLRGEEYHGLAKCDPTPSFVKALEALPGDPVKQADQIVAYFVDYEKGGKRRPVWIIETYGMSSTPSPRYRLEEYQLNHIRAIVDTAGNLVSWNNKPYVE